MPAGLREGQQFQAAVPGSGRVMLRVPPGKRGGDVITVAIGGGAVAEVSEFKSCARTHVVQHHVSDLMAAAEVFHMADDDPTDDVDEKAIVLIPHDACGIFCPRLCFSVPSGMWILKQHCGADVGAELPGFKMAWWGWDRISHVVTRSTVSYSTPVKQCPTADNVRVEIDVSLNFQIGPTMKDARRFVYTLGAARFDELLGAEIEEAVREMVYEVKALRIHDLREEFADGMLRGLNRTMRKFGVEMKNVKITGVKVSRRDLRALQRCALCALRGAQPAPRARALATCSAPAIRASARARSPASYPPRPRPRCVASFLIDPPSFLPPFLPPFFPPQLPASLETALQSKTQFKSQMDEAATKQTLRMIQLNDDYDKRIQNTLRQNARGVQDLHAAQNLSLTDRQREEAKANSHAEVAITNTRGAAIVAKTKATGQKQIALAEALEAANALVERVKADKDARVVGVNQEYSSAVTRAVGGLVVAKAQAQEIDADAGAEAEASVRLAVSRDHEVQELRIAALRRIAKSAKVVVGGATGEGLLAQIAPGSVADLSAGAAS